MQIKPPTRESMITGPVAARGPVGKVIGGKYRLLRCLGEGGMGAVYEAQHTAIGTRVAVKVLRPEQALKTDVVHRFEQEARTTASIGHPNIVTILDLDRDPSEDLLYMVQELLSGIDLRAFLDHSKQLDPQVAIQLCIPVLSALAAAHERGILHRDMKPANIFLCSDGRGVITPKVIDFGVAKVMSGDEETGHTREGMLIGTLSYMSPEQLRGDVTVDAGSDIWAMGVVLYEMLAGECPFKSPGASNLMAIAQFATQVNNEPAHRIEQKVPGIPADLANIIHRALATDRQARFSTMREFCDTVGACSVAMGRRGAAAAPLRGAATESTIIGLDEGDISFITESVNRAAAAPTLKPLHMEIASGAATRSAPTPTARNRFLIPALGALAFLVIAAIITFFVVRAATDRSRSVSVPIPLVNKPNAQAPDLPLAPPAPLFPAKPTVPAAAVDATPPATDQRRAPATPRLRPAATGKQRRTPGASKPANTSSPDEAGLE